MKIIVDNEILLMYILIMINTNNNKGELKMTELSRFDIPMEVRNIMNKAVEIGIMDSVGLVCLTINNEVNLDKVVEEIIEIAFINRHCNTNYHTDIVKLAEQYWLTK